MHKRDRGDNGKEGEIRAVHMGKTGKKGGKNRGGYTGRRVSRFVLAEITRQARARSSAPAIDAFPSSWSIACRVSEFTWHW